MQRGGRIVQINHGRTTRSASVKEAGLPFEEVVACATENPAKAVGLWEKYGSIDNGKYADCVIVDEDFNIRQIVKHGKTVL